MRPYESDKVLFGQTAIRDYRGTNLVFLVGSPRSGTTWLQRLLASNPNIKTGQESHLFNFYIGPQLRIWEKSLDPLASGRGGVGIGCYVTEDEYVEKLRHYMLSLLQPMMKSVEPGEIFLEKTPAHALFIPQILRLLPEARFIHLVRDPRDVVASMLAASESWGARWAPRSASRAAKVWCRHVTAVRESRAILGSRGLAEISYEELYAQPELVLRRLCDFLGLGWADADLNRAVTHNSAAEIREGRGTAIPISGAFDNPDGVVTEPVGFVRRAHPQSWKQDLTRTQLLATLSITGTLMEQLGYLERPPRGGRALEAIRRMLNFAASLTGRTRRRR